MNEKIIPADRTYRRTVLIIYIVLVFMGIVLIGWVFPRSQAYLEGLEAQNALGILKAALVVLFLSIGPLAVYLFTVGRKMMQYGRFPPPGMKVIADTKLVEGKKVKLQGQVVVVLSPGLDSPGFVGCSV